MRLAALMGMINSAYDVIDMTYGTQSVTATTAKLKGILADPVKVQELTSALQKLDMYAREIRGEELTLTSKDG